MVALQRHRVGAVFTGEALAQRVALGEELLLVAQVVARGEVAGLHRLALDLQRGAFGLQRHLLGAHRLQPLRCAAALGQMAQALAALGGELLAFGGDVACELEDFQTRHDLRLQRVRFVAQLLPLQVVVRLQPACLGLRAQPVEVEAEILQLAFGAFLFVAGGLVVVEHFLVAEDVEDEFQQRLGRVFAELVGVALFQRQHLRDRRRQAAPGEAVLVVAQADPVLAVLEHLDRKITVDDGVVARPLATRAADAAGERDLVRETGEERPPPGAARHVGDHRADPREAAFGAAHIAAKVALARATQRKERAQRVEQRGLARAVGPDDGDDLRIQRQREAAPVVPVDEFELFDVEHVFRLLIGCEEFYRVSREGAIDRDYRE